MDIEGPTEDIESRITEAASLIRGARYLTAFTGAGISVESGVPPFCGPGGLWNTYDPRMLELDYFLAHPEQAWPVIREIFYDHFGKAKPNRAHEVLAAWEAPGAGPNGSGLLKTLITQNIDNLPDKAGSRSRSGQCLHAGSMGYPKIVRPSDRSMDASPRYGVESSCIC